MRRRFGGCRWELDDGLYDEMCVFGMWHREGLDALTRQQLIAAVRSAGFEDIETVDDALAVVARGSSDPLATINDAILEGCEIQPGGEERDCRDAADCADGLTCLGVAAENGRGRCDFLELHESIDLGGDQPVNGAWTLPVVDDAAGQTGRIERFELWLGSRAD